MEIKEMIARARAAQKEYQERFNQDTVDEVVKAATKVVYDRTELLAQMAIDETQMGVYEHKVTKNAVDRKSVV